MSLSRQSSYETFVVEKFPKDSLQFLASSAGLRKELDIQGLSEAARKSWATLKQWHSPASCFDNAVTPAIVNKIADRVDECSAAIKTTMGAAQMGRAFADNMAALCEALVRGEDASELISKSIAIADKGYGRSAQAHGQLICVRTGLAEVARKIPSQVEKVEQEKKLQSPLPFFFNGMNHCFVSIPQPTASSDDNDETDTWGSNNMMLQPWIPPSNNYLTFQNVIDQLNSVVADLAPFIDRISRAAAWWGEMKRSLGALAAGGAGVPRARLQDSAECWKGVADQFTLYVYKMAPSMSGFPTLATRIPEHGANGWGACPPSPYPMPPPAHCVTPPRRRASRRPRSIYSDDEPIPAPVPEAGTPKKAALWKRILCMA